MGSYTKGRAIPGVLAILSKTKRKGLRRRGKKKRDRD